MIKNVMKKDLRYVDGQKKIINTYKHEVTVTHRIPYNTGCIRTGFPAYLKGFENYYEEGIGDYRLKKEYRFNRPEYTITVTNCTYDIEVDEEAKNYIRKRVEYHQRLLDKYKKLCEEE